MNFLSKPKPLLRQPKPPLGRQMPRNLAEWLTIATGHLVPSAQARIRAEIEAHLADAVQRHREQGLADAPALAAALTDLGDARAAARRFAREYLTHRDLEKLGVFDRPRGVVSLRPLAPVAMLAFGWIALHNGNDLNFRAEGRLYYTGFLYVVMAAALAVVAFRVLSAFWPSPVAMARRALSLRLILVIFFIILAPDAVWLMDPSPWFLTAGITSLLVVGFYACLTLYRLRKKLRHSVDADLATPPLAKD
jgi:hypothetical protein